MTSLAWFALIATIATALVDHVAVAKGNKPLEYLAKPLVMVWLALFVLSIDATRPDAVGWWLGAVALSMAGDVFLMLPKDRFVLGLAAFLLAHVAYVVGFLQEGISGSWWIAALVLIPVAGVLLATMMKGPGMRPALKAPVTAYVSVIVLMVVSAWSSGSLVAALGASSFMASDALIGWRRFVRELPWMAVTIIVLYHLGQIGLAFFLLS